MLFLWIMILFFILGSLDFIIILAHPTLLSRYSELEPLPIRIQIWLRWPPPKRRKMKIWFEVNGIEGYLRGVFKDLFRSLGWLQLLFLGAWVFSLSDCIPLGPITPQASSFTYIMPEGLNAIWGKKIFIPETWQKWSTVLCRARMPRKIGEVWEKVRQTKHAWPQSLHWGKGSGTRLERAKMKKHTEWWTNPFVHLTISFKCYKGFYALQTVGALFLGSLQECHD